MRRPYSRRNLHEQIDRKALETFLVRQKIAPDLLDDVVSLLGSSLDMIQANKALFRSVFLKSWTQARDKAAAMSGIESGSQAISKALVALWRHRMAATIDENSDHWEAVMVVNGPYFWLSTALAFWDSPLQQSRSADFLAIVNKGLAAAGITRDQLGTIKLEQVVPIVDKVCTPLIHQKTFQLMPTSKVSPMPSTVKIEAMGSPRPTSMALAKGYTNKILSTPSFKLTYIFPK